MIKYDEGDLRSGLRLCSGFFNFKVQISCLRNLRVLLFHFSWCSRLFFLMYAISLLCASILWNNIGEFALYWHSLYSVLMELHQKFSGLLLHNFSSLRKFIFTFVIGREFEQCCNMASSRHWSTSVDSTSRLLRLIEVAEYRGQQWDDEWQGHYITH